MPSPTKGRTDEPVGSRTIDQFCARHRISRAFYFGKLRKAGLGPAEMRLGPKLVRITDEADRAWQRARENPTGPELVELEQAKTELSALGRKAVAGRRR